MPRLRDRHAPFGLRRGGRRGLQPLAIEESPVLSVTEGTVVDVPVRLTGRHDGRVVAHYRAVADEAQDDCQTTDFDAAEGSIEWAPGQIETTVRIWVGEDELAETDERFVLRIEPGEGLPAAHPVEPRNRHCSTTIAPRSSTPPSAASRRAARATGRRAASR